MIEVYSSEHKMNVHIGPGWELSEQNKQVFWIDGLRREGKLKVWINHRDNETVAEFNGVKLSAPIAQFPTPEIYAQLLLVFG